jgi:hypothetical protein
MQDHGHHGPQTVAPVDADSAKSALVSQSEDEIRAEFAGVVRRLSAGRAFMVYWAAGGLLFGAFSLLVFMATQTCRIYSDLWIRYERGCVS